MYFDQLGAPMLFLQLLFGHSIWTAPRGRVLIKTLKKGSRREALVTSSTATLPQPHDEYVVMFEFSAGAVRSGSCKALIDLDDRLVERWTCRHQRDQWMPSSHLSPKVRITHKSVVHRFISHLSGSGQLPYTLQYLEVKTARVRGLLVFTKDFEVFQ